jgi:hypothetical protein
MLKQFLQSLGRELIHAGIWGAQAEILKQELCDHYQTRRESLLQQGCSLVEAEQLAIESLGEPKNIARQAQKEIECGKEGWISSFLRRFECLLLFPAAWLLALIWATFVTMAAFLLGGADDSLTVLLIIAVAPQFLTPVLLALFWILRESFNPVRGWRSLLVSSAYLALSAMLFDLGFALHNYLYRDYYAQFRHGNGSIHYWPSIMIELALAGPLLAIPWLVRLWKLRRAERLTIADA